MNTIFWLIFIFIVARSIWRLLERTGNNGKFEGPLGSPPTGMGRPVPGSEEKPKLQIPEYLTRRGEEQPGYEKPGELPINRKGRAEPAVSYGEPVVTAGWNDPALQGQHARLCPEFPSEVAAVKISRGKAGEKERLHQKRRKQVCKGKPFSDLLDPDQVLMGMAWSQILGPRGGLRPKR